MSCSASKIVTRSYWPASAGSAASRSWNVTRSSTSVPARFFARLLDRRACRGRCRPRARADTRARSRCSTSRSRRRRRRRGQADRRAAARGRRAPPGSHSLPEQVREHRPRERLLPLVRGRRRSPRTEPRRRCGTPSSSSSIGGRRRRRARPNGARVVEARLVEQRLVVARGEAEAAVRRVGLGVVDLEDARRRLLLEPLARIALVHAGGVGEAARRERPRVGQRPVEPEPVAEVDAERSIAPRVASKRRPTSASRRSSAVATASSPCSSPSPTWRCSCDAVVAASSRSALELGERLRIRRLDPS